MKFISLRTKRLQQSKIDKPTDTTAEAFINSRGSSHTAHTYTELRQQIHEDLRVQHPEWIEPSGESPMCDYYETRLMELLRSN